MSPRDLIISILCGAVWLIAMDAAHADILAEDFFLYPDGNLAGQTPSPGPGGTWVAHDDPGSHPALVSGGKVILSQFYGGGGHEDVSIPIGVQAADALLFARFDFMLPSSTNLTGDPPGLNRGSDPITPLDEQGLYFAHFKASSATNQFLARMGVIQPASGGDYGLAINANGSKLNEGTAWPSDLSFDTVYRAVISSDGLTGESMLWIDPADESSTHVTDTKVPFALQLEAFALRQSNDYDGTQVIDNLVVATTFDDALAGTGEPTLFGDYNGNDKIDAADYTAWRDAMTAGSSSLLNDATPGSVDESDFIYWREHFGQTLGSGAGSGVATIPEPSSLFLSVLGFALFGLGRLRSAARVAT